MNQVTPDSEVQQATPVHGELMVASSGQVAAIARAEIDMQITTAKQFPRQVTVVLKEAESMACLNEDVAMSMFYRIPRGGKTIEGPSVRLAEIMAAVWGNLRVQSVIVEADDEFVTVQAAAHDLERNTAISIQKRRRVTKKKSAMRPDADDINLAGLAGMSIALRDAIFKVIPRVYVDQIMKKAQKVGLGDAKSVATTRATALEYFKKLGVTDQQIFDALQVAGMDDIGVDEIITLRGYTTALKDGEVSVESIFPKPEVKSDKPAGNAAVAAALAAKTPVAPKAKDEGIVETKKTAEEMTPPPGSSTVTHTPQEPLKEKKKAAPKAKAPEPKPPEPEPEPEPVSDPKPVEESEPVDVTNLEEVVEREPGDDPVEEEGEEVIPAWFDNWKSTVDEITKWEKGQHVFRTLCAQLKEEINAPYKPLFQKLGMAWADKIASLVDKVSLMLVVEGAIKPIEALVDKETYSYIVGVLAKKKATLK